MEHHMSIVTEVTDGHTPAHIYHSESKGPLHIIEMVTEHIENAIHALTHSGEQPEALATLKTELAKRQTETIQDAKTA
jgi:hypothetical protein